MTSSPDLHWQSRLLQSNYSPPWSVTDDDDRRQRAKQYCSPALCVGGPVKILKSERGIEPICLYLWSMC